MKPQRFDAIIIGAGQAGPPLAGKLAKAGMQVAIIERKFFGGTCVNTGCIPSKTLISSAHVAHLARYSQDFGVIINSVAVDMKRVKKRVDDIVLPLRARLEKSFSELKNCTVYHEHAVFENANTVRVGDQLLQSDKIFINVGARAAIPPIAGLDKVNYFTNSTIMEIDYLPEHLIIIGGSYIGLEFAQMYRRFGAKLTVIEKADRLVPREDPEISAAIKEILTKENIDIHLNTECIAVEKENNNIIVKLNCKTGPEKIIGSHLLLALGRKPNTDDLGIEKAGLAINERGFIEVDDHLRTNVDGIWALGECNGKGAFTHTSYNDFQIVADNLLHQANRKVSDRITAYNLYIDPPLARIGMTETEARKAGKNILIATLPMTRVKRAIINGDSQGFMKAIVDADSKQILGAAILGNNGDEVIHCILDVMYAQAPYTLFTEKAVHIHPTVSELVPTLLENLEEK